VPELGFFNVHIWIERKLNPFGTFVARLVRFSDVFQVIEDESGTLLTESA